MYSTLITAVALFVAPALAGFAINSPEVTQCGTTKISWEKTTGPYNLIVVDAENPCGEPLAEIGDFDKSFVEWKAAIPAGKVIQFSVADSTDEEAWSHNITVKASSDASCLPNAPSTDSTTSTTTTSSFTGGSDSTTKTDGSSDSTTDGGVAPVGAANAGSNAFLNGNSASAARNFNGPVLALSAIAAVAALAL